MLGYLIPIFISLFIQPVDTKLFPNWKEADKIMSIEYRYSDTWCEIASELKKETKCYY